MKKEISNILKGVANSGMLIGNNEPTSFMPFTNQIIEIFQHWLISQGQKDCTNPQDYKYTKAYELSNRLINED